MSTKSVEDVETVAGDRRVWIVPSDGLAELVALLRGARDAAQGTDGEVGR